MALGLFCLGLFCLVSWDYFVWDCFVWEYFAIWDCFVRDCFVWDCFVWDCFVCSPRGLCWLQSCGIIIKVKFNYKIILIINLSWIQQLTHAKKIDLAFLYRSINVFNWFKNLPGKNCKWSLLLAFPVWPSRALQYWTSVNPYTLYSHFYTCAYYVHVKI